MEQEGKWKKYIKDPRGWIDVISIVFLNVPCAIIFFLIFVDILVRCSNIL